MPRLLLLAAAPPPAHPITPGLPPFPEFLWQVEEGPSSAKRWTALPREPRREAKSRPEAGGRPGPLENGPPTTDQLQRTSPGRDGPGSSPTDRLPATTPTQQPRHRLRNESGERAGAPRRALRHSAARAAGCSWQAKAIVRAETSPPAPLPLR